MSIIDTINNAHTVTTTPATGGTNAAAAAAGTLNQNDVLRLMTTQLTTQDPFNPVDNTQMVAQMAQFSQVAGIAEMNQTLRGIAGALGAGRLSDASSWIGRAMLVQSDVATPLGDGTYAGSVTVPANADNVTVRFLDANGTEVHSMDLGAREAGEAAFAWNGKNEAGQTLATGPLRVVVEARAAGAALSPTVATWTAIAGLQSPANGGEARLVTGLGLLKPPDAIRIA